MKKLYLLTGANGHLGHTIRNYLSGDVRDVALALLQAEKKGSICIQIGVPMRFIRYSLLRNLVIKRRRLTGDTSHDRGKKPFKIWR